MTKIFKTAIKVLKTYSRKDLTKSTDEIAVRELGLDIEDFEEDLFDFRLASLIDIDLNGIIYEENIRRSNRQYIIEEIFDKNFSDDYINLLQDIVIKSYDLEITEIIK